MSGVRQIQKAAYWRAKHRKLRGVINSTGRNYKLDRKAKHDNLLKQFARSTQPPVFLIECLVIERNQT